MCAEEGVYKRNMLTERSVNYSINQSSHKSHNFIFYLRNKYVYGERERERERELEYTYSLSCKKSDISMYATYF